MTQFDATWTPKLSELAKQAKSLAGTPAHALALREAMLAASAHAATRKHPLRGEVEWYYLDSVGEEFGPVSTSDMGDWFRQGRFPVGGDLLVRMKQWPWHMPLYLVYPNLDIAFDDIPVFRPSRFDEGVESEGEESAGSSTASQEGMAGVGSTGSGSQSGPTPTTNQGEKYRIKQRRAHGQDFPRQQPQLPQQQRQRQQNYNMHSNNSNNNSNNHNKRNVHFSPHHNQQQQQPQQPQQPQQHQHQHQQPAYSSPVPQPTPFFSGVRNEDGSVCHFRQLPNGNFELINAGPGTVPVQGDMPVQTGGFPIPMPSKDLHGPGVPQALPILPTLPTLPTLCGSGQIMNGGCFPQTNLGQNKQVLQIPVLIPSQHFFGTGPGVQQGGQMGSQNPWPNQGFIGLP